jgi:cell division protein FtsB
MNSAWLLRSSTLWGALIFSSVLSMALVLLSPAGMPSQRKLEAELLEYRLDLRQKMERNRELAEEVKRLAARDPELFEGLARRQGYARPGETVYTFRDRSEPR